MIKRKEISIPTKCKIIKLHISGKSNSRIARELTLPRRTVDCILKRLRNNNTISNPKRPGRPYKTTLSDDRYIARISKRNRRLVASEIAAEINLWENPISVTTVKRRLRSFELYGRVAVKNHS
ncbi:uncharacterized protein LOC135923821 [Gordionus sp. m RMFG-2023]|uniref:uncharacterized protein LOC135923821 n=1 Tax=Gordionus sp. m RMFG-2023 TaxID=3053472 RepID=UPI0031FC09EF